MVARATVAWVGAVATIEDNGIAVGFVDKRVKVRLGVDIGAGAAVADPAAAEEAPAAADEAATDETGAEAAAPA